MKYPKEYLDEIKNKLKVSEVVGKSVKLKRRGKEFVGLSPFSNEKTPSFTVNDQKGFYHCFSSAEHGNIFDFIMKTENLKFGEAVRKLAELAGMQIYKFSKSDEIRERNWNLYAQILKDYEKYCFDNIKSKNFIEVKNYLLKRKITQNEIEEFRIGYASKNDEFLKNYKNIYSEEQLKISGLFFYDEKRKIYIERFKGRLIFPIKNLNGTTIAFGGRKIENSKSAKYINSPETLFYKKGNNLFNIQILKSLNQKENDELFVVEGFTDVISLSRHGVRNVVANQGTALTNSQLDLIWRFSNKPIICFDGDQSGKDAALRAAEKIFLYLKPEYNVFFLFLPDNLDPDNFINQQGLEKFINFSKNKMPIYDFLWEHHLSTVDIKNPSSYANLEKKLKYLCSQIYDKSLNKYFLEYFLKKIHSLTPFSNNISNIRKYGNINIPLGLTKKITIRNEKFSKKNLKEFSLIYIILNFYKVFNKNIELISEISFSNKEINSLKNELINTSASNEKVDLKKIYFNEKSQYFKIIKQVEDFAPIKNLINKNDIDEKKIEDLMLDIIGEINSLNNENKIEDLERKLINQMDENTFQNLLKLKEIQKKS